jgi:hypothetical protein
MAVTLDLEWIARKPKRFCLTRSDPIDYSLNRRGVRDVACWRAEGRGCNGGGAGSSVAGGKRERELRERERERERERAMRRPEKKKRQSAAARLG